MARVRRERRPDELRNCLFGFVSSGRRLHRPRAACSHCLSLHRLHGIELEEAKMECGYAVMSFATVGVLALGSAIVFAVMTTFALRHELPDMAKPHLFALPGDATLTWQAGELMFDLAGRMQRTHRRRAPRSAAGAASRG